MADRLGASALDAQLTGRLRAIGLDPADFGDPGRAWLRLHDRFGRRVTLVDRYALEAAARGIRPEELDADERTRLTAEVVAAQYPELEFTAPWARQVPDPVELVPYTDEWPASFAAWRQRLHRALGATAERIEHVGSTAVPGLTATPVVDIQVSVRDVDDEDAYVPAIEGLDVSLLFREPGYRYFRPALDQLGPLQIHVCATGGDWERSHLLFRDFLRAQPAARADYARLREELASRYGDDRLAYHEAKTGFIIDCLDAAWAWAERTGWQLPPRF